MALNAEEEHTRSIAFFYTEDEFIASCRAIRMAVDGSYVRRFIRLGLIVLGHVFMFSGLTLAAMWAAGAKGEKGPIPLGIAVYGLAMGGLCAFALYRYVYFHRRHLRSRYRSFPLRDEKVLCTFTPLRYTIQQKLAQSSVDWSLIPKVTEFRDGFIIHYSAQAGNWIPKHALDGPFEDVEFAEFLRSRVKDYKFINRFAGLRKKAEKKPLNIDLDSHQYQ